MTTTRLIALTVFGGFRMAWETWKLTPEGWDAGYDTDELGPTVWATEAECLAAIEKVK